MNRIRFAMATDSETAPKLTGTVECDETYVAGKPRYKGKNKRGHGTKKIPVFAAVERNGGIHRRVITNVTGKTLRKAIRETVDSKARIIKDDFRAYGGIGSEYAGGHESVCHSTEEYVRGDIHTNTAETSFALIKRGLTGIYHTVSGEYLHRYLWQFDFIWNNRNMNDGERTELMLQSTEGKRLMYKQPKGTVA
jgi:transposase-like protein